MTLDITKTVVDGYPRNVAYWRSSAPALGIFLLHPTGGSSKSSLLGGRWNEHADLSICAPEGLGFDPETPASPSNPRAWSSRCGPMLSRTFDDAQYLLALARDFASSLPEGTPLCLVGHSNGCAISFNQLLSRAAHPFDMAVLYAANWADPVGQVKRIPLLYMAGECDPIYPWNESRRVDTPWFAYQTVPTGPTVASWLSAIGMPGALPQFDGQDASGRLKRWRGAQGQVFDFRVLQGQGHHWAAKAALDAKLQAVLGPNNEALSATELALAFFREHQVKVRPPVLTAAD